MMLAALTGAAALSLAPAERGAVQEVLEIEPVPIAPVADGFTLAAAGDLIYLRPMIATIEANSPDMLRRLRDADVTFGNFETSVLDLSTTAAVPQAQSGGTWMLADPRVPADVVRMGFDIVSHANNHATDWGVEGTAETGRRLSDAGLIWAGTGKNLAAAQAPRYLDTAKGRIAIVSASSTFTPMSPATNAAGEVPARPGVNSLRTVRTTPVTIEQLTLLKDLAARSPVRGDGVEGDIPVLFGNRFAVGEPSGDKLEFSYRMNDADLRDNLKAIRQARQNGNFVIFSMHNHEPGNDFETPADFTIDLAHRAIDAGADVYAGHGPHRLRGIEIYKRRPIFYSLGNFAMMNNSLDALPADMFDQFGIEPGAATVPELLQARNARSFAKPELYESVIAVSKYSNGDLVEIRLYPIDLGVDLQGAARGVPRLASVSHGEKILKRLQALSAPFGTSIAIDKGIGVIRIPD